MREAIKKRTESLGIEKSVVSKEAIKEAEERAKAGVANRGAGGEMETMLDLTQISQTAPRGQDDETPAMFYEPETEMTEEEMKEADPDGQMPILDQVRKELSLATWPTPAKAIKEIALLLFIFVFTSALIINWDNFLRNFYTDLGFIPRPEDIMQGSENLALPDGWTNGMSEDDFMKFQDEVAATAKSGFNSAPIETGFPEL